jgi:hypothetical protein
MTQDGIHSSSLQLVQGKKSEKHNYHINSWWEGNMKVKTQHIVLTTTHLVLHAFY